MLIELNINNLKLIKKAQLQFGQGFHVITGESGAGKSMLLSAFKLLLGEKPQGDIVYPNTKKSQIEAIFDIKPLSLLREKMLELGVEDDDETLILRREISSDLRSKIFANNTRITQKTLKELSGELIDFHGQNTHQSLLDNKKHGPILDEYLELEQDLEAYLLAYKAYLKINQDYEDARGSVKEETQELDYLKFQFQELITLNLRVGEYEELQEERHRLKNVTVYNLLLEETNLLFDGEHSVQSNLQKMAISLNKLKDLDGKFHDLAINISELSLQASDASSEFARYNSTDFLDPEQLEKIEERLFALESIQRKHHRNIPEIIQWQESLQDQIDRSENKDLFLKELNDQKKNQEKETYNLAQNLHQKRQKGKGTLEKAIRLELHELGIQHAQFVIDLKENSLHTRGYDTISFLIGTNKGARLAPLRDIASGGEISRIMLALKSVFVQMDTITILIFDEMDANLGGETALIVGEKLETLAQSKQLICITHLPQIASRASHHFYVQKLDTSSHSHTDIKILDRDERIGEIARMLGGNASATIAQKHALELLGSSS